MKFRSAGGSHELRESPSTRRVWIEIKSAAVSSGLKEVSPSTRRVWIEIISADEIKKQLSKVTLHTEGVD